MISVYPTIPRLGDVNVVSRSDSMRVEGNTPVLERKGIIWIITDMEGTKKGTINLGSMQSFHRIREAEIFLTTRNY